MSRIALYPGSFDPPTKGHHDLIRRAARLADRVVVAIAVNPAKQPLFSVEERLDLLRQTVGEVPGVEFAHFEGSWRTTPAGSAPDSSFGASGPPATSSTSSKWR